MAVIICQVSRPFILTFRPGSVNNSLRMKFNFAHKHIILLNHQVRNFPAVASRSNVNHLNDYCTRWWQKFPWISTVLCSQSSTNVKFSRAMSQHSKPDEDIDRMHRALQQSSVPQGASDTGGDRLLYEVRAIWMMRFCTLLFYATSLMGLYMSPDIISSALEHEGFNSELIIDLAGVFTGVVALPVLLTMFNKRLVLKMYYSSQRDSYAAMTMSIFLRLKRVEFLRKDVVRSSHSSSILGLFNLTTLKAKGHPYFINPYNFKLSSDYNRLMGYEREF